MTDDKPATGSIIDIDPSVFFRFNRLDLAIKLIYAEAVKTNSKSTYPRNIYRKHLFSITGGNGKFIEYGNSPPKIGFSQFEEVFISLIKGCPRDFPPVSIDSDFRLTNGAHRAVAGFINGQSVSAILVGKPRNILADYNFFKNAHSLRHHLGREDLDHALLKLCSINPNIQVLIVYPSMRNKILLAELRSHPDFFLERSFRLNPKAKIKLLDFLYPNNENFVNLTPENNYIAYRDRFNAPGKVRVFFFETHETITLEKLKSNLRNKYKLLNGAIHTPDTFEETIELLEVLLIKNSRKYLQDFDLEYARALRGKLKDLHAPSPERLVVGSSSLALIGVRFPRDLDIVSYSHVVDSLDSKIDMHTQYWLNRGFNVDELIDNPRDYIKVYGTKYVSIGNLAKFKLKRHERKDVRDICLILRLEVKRLMSFPYIADHFIKGYLRIFRDSFLREAR